MPYPRIPHHNSRHGPPTLDFTVPDPAHLTYQELRLWHLIYQCYTLSQIALIMHIADNTAKNYRRTLYSKLNIHRNTEAIKLHMLTFGTADL